MLLPAQEPPPAVASATALPPAATFSWIRKPTSAEVRAVYPAEALAGGVGGTGQISCSVQPDDTLAACKDFGEAPRQTGFGAAVLALSPTLRIHAVATRQGRLPTVLIPIRFDPPAPAPGALPVTPSIAFTAAPDARAVAAAAPSAPAGKLKGLGVMRCTVSSGALGGCAVAGGDSRALSRAAVSLAPSFAVAPTLADGRSAEGLVLNVAVAFGAEPLPSPSKPQWVSRPTPAQVAASFPAEARDRGLAAVSVVLRCRMGADGAPQGCLTASEDPVGVGGAQAAARLAGGYRASVWDGRGRPLGASPIDLEIVLKPEATPTPAAQPSPAAAKPQAFARERRARR